MMKARGISTCGEIWGKPCSEWLTDRVIRNPKPKPRPDEEFISEKEFKV